MKQFTERFLASIKPQEKKFVLREGRGFALQVLPTGTKTFLYIFELNKQKGYYQLGNYPAMSLADARVAYNDAYNLVKKGIDPREEKKAAAEEKAKIAMEAALEAEAATRAADHLENYSFETLTQEEIPEDFVPTTVEQLAAVWFIDYSKENHSKRWQETILSAIRTHIIPNIGKMEISSVRHKHALTLIQQIAVNVPGSARNTMKFCRQMFKYACRQEWAEIQPFHEITESVPKIAPKADERHLDDDEIVKAWYEINKSSSSREVKRALKLILVTAQRPGEVAQIHRDQIKDKWWTIPAEVAGKNEREHRVYLTDTALKLIGDGKGHIFPSERGKRGHISENALSQAINRGYLSDDVVKVVGNRKIKARKEPYFGMKPWSPHDLRRTARTNMARVGVSDEVGEEVMNHIKPGVVGVYNKYRYDEEKKIALQKWEALLLEILKTKPENTNDLVKAD
ncbi:integrase arm-type DNA-binding domain-containing protein [Geobacter pelophilus]|uniref:Integrase arm-type DNA-binding domain-containing protein n=1 Tax=Geoanaerobacter pelophilus TaxID=60036 RepID=A0AAW4KWR1_9BACT|nr:site-specific integrase [Geoanaerobacter pelophilus]MBT0663031.1 integrase arm-type DNA-binding domain-containing protein [Geoanaerobacter pelophilus]